jgi:hypothetical protein
MALGSALQLAINLCGMVIAGTSTLLLQRRLRQHTVPM